VTKATAFTRRLGWRAQVMEVQVIEVQIVKGQIAKRQEGPRPLPTDRLSGAAVVPLAEPVVPLIRPPDDRAFCTQG
jgi:hypothetical protein